MNRLLVILTLFFFFVVTHSSWTIGASGSDTFESMKIFQTQRPIYPGDLRRTGVAQGSATIAFEVDAEGKLIDYLPIGYSHGGFYTSAINALTRWRFEPARDAGQPRPVVQILTFNFEDGQDVVAMSVGDNVVARINQIRSTVEEYRICRRDELDQEPVPVAIVNPRYPEGFLGSQLEGSATIEFYIDESGIVRLPAVIEQSAAEFASAAIEAVRQWRFEPPTKGGERVSVAARQRFHFAPSPPEQESDILESE